MYSFVNMCVFFVSVLPTFLALGCFAMVFVIADFRVWVSYRQQFCGH